MPNLDTIHDCSSTNGIKWNHYAPDVIPLWIADMDFKAPQPVIDALAERARQGMYGLQTPSTTLAETIAELMGSLHQWAISPEEIIFLPGITDGLSLASRAAGNSGDQVLIQTPVYTPFLNAPAKADQLPLLMPWSMGANGRYYLDLDRFDRKFTKRTSSFLLCNPHNPVGKVFSRGELEHMASTCLRNQSVIISDDIHGDLVYSGRSYQPIAAIDPEIADHTITLIAPTKTFNMAGLKFGAAIIQNKTLRENFLRVLQKFTGYPYHLSVFAYTGIGAAYKHRENWLRDLLPYLEENRDLLFSAVNENLPGMRMEKTEATFLAWLDCREANLAPDPARFFLEHARVGLSCGSEFGSDGAGFVRLNFACPRSVLIQALQQMKNALLSHTRS